MENPLVTALFLVAAWLHPSLNIQIRFLKSQLRAAKANLRRHGIEYPILTPAEKDELLRLGEVMNHKVGALFLINTMGTYRRWLRNKRGGREQKMPGRLRRITQEDIALMIRLAKENVDWGCARIAGEFRKIGKRISDSSILRILRRNGHEPKPGKGRQKGGGDGVWKKFIDGHMDTTVAIDFFTCKLITLRGIFLAHSLIFLHHATRRVWLSHPTLNPEEEWNIRQLKGAFWWFEDQGIELRYLIRDRDGKYSEKFDSVVKELTSNKKAVVRTSVRAPNMNAYAESMIGHMRSECHNHFWYFLSLEQLGHVNSEYMRFHNCFRPHQGKNNEILTPIQAHSQSPPTGVICRMDLLGGILHHYYREAS